MNVLTNTVRDAAELFATSVNPKIKTKGLLEILSNSTEFGRLPVRHHEAKTLEGIFVAPSRQPDCLLTFSPCGLLWDICSAVKACAGWYAQ